MKNIYILFFFIIFITPKAYTQIQTLSFQVNQSSDDAEESEDASDILITSSDLELVFDDFSDQIIKQLVFVLPILLSQKMLLF